MTGTNYYSFSPSLRAARAGGAWRDSQSGSSMEYFPIPSCQFGNELSPSVHDLLLRHLRFVQGCATAPCTCANYFYLLQPLKRIGYLANNNAIACAVRLARPCSHFSRVRSLVNTFRANTPREERNRSHTCWIAFGLTSGSVHNARR